MSNSFDRPLVISMQSLLNICATGYPEQILEAIPTAVSVAGCILHPSHKEIGHSLDRVFPDFRQILEGMITKKILHLAVPETDAEWLRFFELSKESPKTQTASSYVICSIAPERTWGIISDQPIIRAFGGKYVPQVPVITTLMVIFHWCETRSVSVKVLRSALMQAKELLHYQAFVEDPLFDWWKYHMEDS